MKAAVIVGIVLIVLGIIGLAAGEQLYRSEEGRGQGRIQLQTFRISPIVSTISPIAGVGHGVVG